MAWYLVGPKGGPIIVCQPHIAGGAVQILLWETEEDAKRSPLCGTRDKTKLFDPTDQGLVDDIRHNEVEYAAWFRAGSDRFRSIRIEDVFNQDD
jgi:hypothetical protein